MKIKRNLLFFVDKEGNQEKGYKLDGKLRLRIRFTSGKVDFNVGYRVDIAKWTVNEAQDFGIQKVKVYVVSTPEKV